MPEPTPPTEPPPGRTREFAAPHRPTPLQRFVGRLIYLGLRSLAWTMRYSLDDRSGHFEPPGGGPAIYAVWHNRLALVLSVYWRYGAPRTKTPGMAAMVSASKDGALLTSILEAFRVQPVRGSTSRRGRQALRELAQWGEKGYDLAITPDGPRGPCYVVQEGVIAVAQLTGLPILPFGFKLDWKIRLKSWDRFQIPLPFSRCHLRVAPPIRVPRDASQEDRGRLRLELQETLRSISSD